MNEQALYWMNKYVDLKEQIETTTGPVTPGVDLELLLEDRDFYKRAYFDLREYYKKNVVNVTVRDD